ncbi:protein IQ-DOMAIN 14 [Cajanus cajan]|uniref:Protein IQ-DOMAIN 31 n=1 Tax=Cajanus cajan TaxID=3821 RepID=A0A151TXQ2_CAJCA|nr:protein IQ-DOMAIN 14 [Cajanus cajan]KYP71816.1 Protein IQ-DOMAIN 31 [Cajanus cajan]
MGKASKWIRNFLLGKKEEKLKKIDGFCPEDKSVNKGSQIVSSKVKRRWSFGKLTGGRITSKVAGHKFSRSFDSGDSAKLQIQALLEAKTPRRLPTPLAKASRDKNKAAIKIQAGFRSYLAKRALHALKGLVKLQALVRGHLVRKQTTATLRGMHALMAIQVRARIHRIQMAEEANLLGKQPPQHTEVTHFSDFITEENKDSWDMSVEEMLEVLKSRSGPLDGSHVKSRERDSMTFYSKHLPVVSKRQNQYKNTLIMSEINPTTMALSTSQRHSVTHRQSLSPNYMNKTESSRAKARSQSEPKQRPKQGTRHKGKSVEYPLNGPRQNLFSNSLRYDHGSLDHWVINLHGSMKDSRRDSFGSSSVTTDSYY